MSNTCISALKLSLAGLLLAAGVYAQTGSISGTVRTQSGGPLANATVNLENLTSNARQSATTDANGKYQFNSLPGGSYRISMSTAQFIGTPSEDITLDPNRPKTVDITVQGNPTMVSSMQVEESTPELDTTTPRIVVTYNTRDVQYLPQANLMQQDGEIYGAYNLSLLSPGIGTAPLSVARGPVVGGQRPISNNFYVDGVDNNNRALPGPLVYVPEEATTEFTAFQNQFPAEWGHTLGGQFNTEVRSGTNQVHGALYEYLENRNLNAVDQRFANEGLTNLPRFDQNRMGGNLGLPIIPNKMFLFVDFEYIPLGFTATPYTSVYAPTASAYQTLARLPGVSATNLGLLQTYLGAAPTASSTALVAGTQVPIGILPITAHQYQNQWNGVGSWDWNISNTDQIRARYVQNSLSSNNNGAELPAFYSPLYERNLLASVAEYHNFSPVFVNELRLGYTRLQNLVGSNSNPATFPGLSAFPNIGISGDLNVELGSGLYATRPTAMNNYQLSDNVNLQAGRHTFKFGGEFRRFIGPVSLAEYGNGVYNYSSLSGFLLNQAPSSGLQSYGNLTFTGNNYDAYAYANDSWKLRSNLTINLGVHYDYVTIPLGLQNQAYNSIASVPGLINFNTPNTQKTAFGPLVGLAYSPGFVKNTVIRAGFGMNYDTTYTLGNVPTIPPGYTTSYYVGGLGGFYPGGFFGYGPYGFGPFGGGILNVFTPTVTPAQARAATTAYVPDQRLPYSMQWNFDWQQQIFHRLVFTARYLGVKSVHLPALTDLNGTSPVTASTGLPLFYSQPSQSTLNSLTTSVSSLTSAGSSNAYTAAGFTNPISAVEPWGYSWYNGLQLQANQRFSAGLQGIVSYTWSHLIDNLSGPGYSPTGNPLAEFIVPKGTSPYDHRQRVTGTMLWDLSGIGKDSFNWVRDILANVTFGGTYTYQTPSTALLQSGVNTDLTGLAYGGVIQNPNGTSGIGSGVSPLTNSSGQVVGYLVNNPNARYISGAPGLYTSGSRNTIGFNPINNFDATLYKDFAIRDKFKLEFHADAYNVLNHPQFTASSINSIGLNPLSASRNFLTPGTAAFGNPALAFPSNARMLQVGIRLFF